MRRKTLFNQSNNLYLGIYSDQRPTFGIFQRMNTPKELKKEQGPVMITFSLLYLIENSRYYKKGTFAIRYNN